MPHRFYPYGQPPILHGQGHSDGYGVGVGVGPGPGPGPISAVTGNPALLPPPPPQLHQIPSYGQQYFQPQPQLPPPSHPSLIPPSLSTSTSSSSRVPSPSIGPGPGPTPPYWTGALPTSSWVMPWPHPGPPSGPSSSSAMPQPQPPSTLPSSSSRDRQPQSQSQPHSRAPSPSPIGWRDPHDYSLEQQHHQALREQYLPRPQYQQPKQGAPATNDNDAMSWEYNAIGGGRCFVTDQQKQRGNEQQNREQANIYDGQIRNGQTSQANEKEEEESIFDTFGGTVVSLGTGSRFDQLLEAKMNMMNQSQTRIESMSNQLPATAYNYMTAVPQPPLAAEHLPPYQPTGYPPSHMVPVVNGYSSVSQSPSLPVQQPTQSILPNEPPRHQLPPAMSSSWPPMPAQYPPQPMAFQSPSNGYQSVPYSQPRPPPLTTPSPHQLPPPAPTSTYMDPAAVERRLQDWSQTHIQPDLVAPMPIEISSILDKQRSASGSERGSSLGYGASQTSQQGHADYPSFSLQTGMNFSAMQNGFASTSSMNHTPTQPSTPMAHQLSRSFTNPSLSCEAPTTRNERGFATQLEKQTTKSSPHSSGLRPPQDPISLTRTSSNAASSSSSPSVSFSAPPHRSISLTMPSELPWSNPGTSTTRPPPNPLPHTQSEPLPPVLKIRVVNSSEPVKRESSEVGQSAPVASTTEKPGLPSSEQADGAESRPDSKKFSLTAAVAATTSTKKGRGKGKAKKAKLGDDRESTVANGKENTATMPTLPAASKSQSSTSKSKKRKSEAVGETKEERDRRLLDKTTIACNMCRAKKLKCNGDRPRCYHCARRGEEACTYDPVLRRRGKGKNNKNHGKGKEGSEDRDREEGSSPSGDSESDEPPDDRPQQMKQQKKTNEALPLGPNEIGSGEKIVSGSGSGLISRGEHVVEGVGDMSYLLKKEGVSSGGGGGGGGGRGVGIGMGFGGVSSLGIGMGIGMGSGSRFELSTERG
ncbi:hypothetical protein CI109_106745 [Kwoniella shandongensis]|uniref:Uncharacterized protein n=1 Tax=Kwoniella shandongensis TaxID=1734106 RepID=A0A5M6C6T1_9TREE|nr:uncharacterized protein CI109_000998 [Kwoniella shandongensis]KAA5530818.1 hypothetical protein CI109_000998 [Kwoniella shandongensis]